MNDHLGNVLATVLDRKTGATFNGIKPLAGSTYDHWNADIASSADYYPGGMMMPGRNTEYKWSRMGSQGQVKDDEFYGKGNAYAFKYRMQYARINRFMTTDPLHAKYPYNSDYAFAENSFVCGIDLEGLELLPVNTGMFRMGVNSGSNKIVTLNEKNIPAAFKNSDGTAKFTPASVGVTPQGQVMLTNTPSLNPANSVPANPEWAWGGQHLREMETI